ncbi:iron ABC transporter substrate-binding protein [Telmatospirillum sp. J64-1]|uniref:iron ABC transporter substrate-binding protein n=1 Tax=Telmatospirillum sp. J64-1 TaxID=2502183 RepID=UPI002103DE51|nr:iron ABC transporter substrate-binding protein [Telmatospirillum sp. J64-1]
MGGTGAAIFRTGVLLLLCLTFVPPALAREVEDDAGRLVPVPAEIGRAYGAGAPAAILLYTLAPDMMLGWPRPNSSAEAAFMPPRYAALPELGRLTGRGDTANLEEILAVRPDLLFDYGTINPTYISLADQIQAQTRLPYLLFDGSFDRIPEAYRKLGQVLGVEERAERLAAYAEATLEEARETVAAIPPAKRPRVYYARGPEGLETGLAGSINTEMLDILGAENVAKAAGIGGLSNVSIEQVWQWDPDVILTLEPHFHANVWEDPRWRNLRAVREGRVYLAPSLPFGWFDRPPSVNRLIGLRWLLAVLYPDNVQIPLREETRHFYRLFYHQEPSEEQLDQLLSAARPTRP